MFVTSGRHISAMKGIPTLTDVAISLSRTPMAAGHYGKFFSVAHHSLCVAEMMPKHKIYGLFHEVEVAVVGDCPGPMKTAAQRKIEHRIRDQFIASFNLPPITSALWNFMEGYDQKNLAACSRVLGMTKGAARFPRSEKGAEAVVRRILKIFPPSKQLGAQSPLVLEFLRRADTLVREEKVSANRLESGRAL